MNQYASTVVLVLRDDIMLAQIPLFDTADMVAPEGSDYYYLKWNSVLGWGMKSEPIYQWLAMLRSDDYQLLIDGADTNDFEIRGTFTDHAISIGIRTPRTIADEPYHPWSDTVWYLISYGSIVYCILHLLSWV